LGKTQGGEQIDGVLDDVLLVFQGREDVDCGIGDDNRPVEARHIHDEGVADASLGAQAGGASHHRAHQLVGMQTAFHQHLGLALAGQLHGLGGRVVAVFRIHYFVL
jgi:hypothetical protein